MSGIVTVALPYLVKLLAAWGPQILQALLLPAIVYAFAKGRDFVEHHVKSAKLKALLLFVDDAIEKAVKMVAQTYVDALKEKAADGNLTPDEQREAMARALASAKSLLPPWVLELLGAFFPGGVDDFLRTRIEAAVADVKPAPAAGPAGIMIPLRMDPPFKKAPVAPVATMDQAGGSLSAAGGGGSLSGSNVPGLDHVPR